MTMDEFFKLISTYDVVMKFSTNVRPIRIEILQSTENPKKLRASVWDQNTYDLYPTFANMNNDQGAESKLWSSDELNREITTLLSEDPNDLFWGKEWDSESDLLNYIKSLIKNYNELFSE